MAKGDGKTLEKLYIELGLDLSQLQSDILAADKTVTENLGRLNRERNLIKIRMQADVSGLDAAKDATQILAIQEKALNEQLTVSKDRLAILEAAYKQVAANKNSTALAVQNAEKQWQRERIEVGRLEAALKSLASQKVSIDTARLNESVAKINAQIKAVKLKAEIDTSKLSGATAAFDAQKAHISAVTRELELQKQKLVELQAAMKQATAAHGADNIVTLNIKSNVLEQTREIQRLETKLKELRATDVNLKFRTDALKQAEQTISENISRINARIENIRVKADVDVSKISGATAEFDKAKAHVAALNQELTLQNQKLVEMRNALKNSAIVNGFGNVKTINLATDIQRQIQEINQLEAKIKELNSIQPPKSGLLSGYLGIKGDVTAQLNSITTAFSNLRGATSSADNALVSVLGVIDSIPSPVGKAATALLGLPIIFAGIENSVVDMMKATAAAGDATYVMSRGFQMSVADTGKFTTMCKTAGVEVNDLASTLKRVQQSIVRGGEDAKAEQWLKRYGESAFDASGRLKDLNAMTLTLSRALKRAQADGNGMAFILATMRNASADAITAIEDAEGVYEQASTIVKAGLANPALAHEVQGNLNALGVQSAQLGTSFKNALLPVANEIVPRMTERMGHMTQIIKDNKDVILDLGRDFAQVWGAVEDTVDKVGEGLGVLANLARENRVVRQTDQKTLIEKYKDDTAVQSSKDLVEREIANGGYTDEDIKKLRSRNDLYQKEIKRHNADMKKLLEQRREEFAKPYQAILDKYKGDNSIKTMTDLMGKLTDAEKAIIDNDPSKFFGSFEERVAALNLELQKLNKTAAGTKNEIKSVSEAAAAGAQVIGDTEERRTQLERAKKYYDETATIRYRLDNGDYKAQRYELMRKTNELLEQEELSAIERSAILENYHAKADQLEQDRAKKIAEIQRSINAELRLSYDERQKLIEETAQKFIATGEDEASAYSRAQDEINSKFKTSLEERIAKIEDEKQAWIQAGMDREEAENLTQQRIDKAREEAAQKAKDYYREAADIRFNASHTALEKELRDIDRWLEAQAKVIQSEEERTAAAEAASARRQAALQKETDLVRGLNQSLEDKIFAQEHSQYENDVRKLQQEVVRQAQEYQKHGAFNDEARAKLERYYNNALGELNKRARESQAKGGDYTKAPRTDGQVQILDFEKPQQPDIGLFAAEDAARRQVEQGLTKENQALVNGEKATNLAADAQKNFAQTATDAAQSFQKIDGDEIADAIHEAAHKIEIIEGDQIVGSETADAGAALSLDELLANNLQKFTESLPAQEMQALTTQTQEVTTAEKDLQESTKSLATTQADGAKTFSDAIEKIKKVSFDDIGKGSGKHQDTDVPTKATKSAPRDDQQPQREKVHLQTRPKDDSFKLSDLGFDWDVFGTLTEAGLGLASLARLAPHPALKIGGIILGGAIGAATAKGTFDNRNGEYTNELPQKSLSADAGTFADVDFSELATPLSSLDENVQGIRSILQGKDATADAKAEGLESTSENSSWSELLTPLNSLDESVQSIWQRLQGERADEKSSETTAEINSEMATKIADSVTAPIKQLAQELQAKETTTDVAPEKSSDGESHLATIDGKVQSILEKMQAAKPESTSPETKADTPEISFNELLDPLKKIDTSTAGILSEMQAAKTESTEQSQAETPEVNFSELLSPLGTIRDDVKSILQNLQSAETAGKDDSVDLLTPLSDIKAKADGILQELQNQRLATKETSPAENVDYLTPLTNIRDNVAGMWNKMSAETASPEQAVTPQENIREIFGQVIANVNSPLSDIVSAIANKQIELPPIEFPVETIVTPLDSINGMVSKIVDLLSNREPPKVEISPNMDIDLGGAYVFDDALKRELVADITSNIVDRITAAVERATSRVSYG